MSCSKTQGPLGRFLLAHVHDPSSCATPAVARHALVYEPLPALHLLLRRSLGRAYLVESQELLPPALRYANAVMRQPNRMHASQRFYIFGI